MNVCMYICMHVCNCAEDALCDGGGLLPVTAKAKLCLIASCLLTAVQSEPNHYHQLETSFGVI